MKAIILAAGRGSRLKNLTVDRPKCMTQLAGKPLLQWQLQALRGAGVSEIGLVRGYLADQLAFPGLETFDNLRWAQTNMVMSLACAREWLEQDACLISYSDIVYPASTVLALLKAQGDIGLTYDRDWRRLWEARFAKPLEDAETFRCNSQGFLTEIGHRAASFEAIEGQYMGLLKLTPRGWQTIADFLDALPAENRDKLDMTTLLQLLLQQGARIKAVPVRGNWFEIDNEQDLRICEQWLMQDNFLQKGDK